MLQAMQLVSKLHFSRRLKSKTKTNFGAYVQNLDILPTRIVGYKLRVRITFLAELFKLWTAVFIILTKFSLNS